MTDAPAPLIPALAGVYRRVGGWGYPLIRIAAGLMLVPHGWAKLVDGEVHQLAANFAVVGPVPAGFWAYLVASVELFGGLMLAAGLLTRLAAAAIAIEMAVIVLKVHLANGFFWTRLGYEFPLLWGLVCLGILCAGSGPASLDRAIGREL